MPDVDSCKYNYFFLNDCYPTKVLPTRERGWNQKKLAAAKKAGMIVRKHVVLLDYDTDNDDDSLESFDAMYDDTKDWRRRNNLDNKCNSVDKFCMALPNNLVFTTGFDLVKQFDRPILSDTRCNCCYCPCSHKMSKWQKQFNVQRESCSDIKKCTPAALFDHLRSHDDVYHKAVMFYLENLYSDVLEDSKPGRKASHGIKWEKHVWSTSE